jgi:hypothetical protein
MHERHHVTRFLFAFLWLMVLILPGGLLLLPFLLAARAHVPSARGKLSQPREFGSGGGLAETGAPARI